MNVLSLFDGMSAGRIALERAGIKVDNYFASEIDKYAIKVSKANWQDVTHVGDVTNLSYKDGVLYTEAGEFPVKIDLVIGGSPCVGFSMAGKQLAFADPQSKLYFEYERLLKEVRAYNPEAKFLLENVKMKQEYKDTISERLGVTPIAINSNLVSAQNRHRLYWTDIAGVQQPEDKGIVLRDILQENVDDKYTIKRGRLQWLKDVGAQKEARGFVAFNPEKAKCLTVRGEPSWNTTYVVGGYVPGKPWGDVKDGELSQSNIRQGNRVDSVSGKSPTLTSQGGNMAGSSVMVIGGFLPEKPWGVVGEGGITSSNISQGNRVYSVQGKSPALCCGASGRTIQIETLLEHPVRKLTPEECERLQTVPDGYTNHVSESQRYKMLGNGWTVDILAHVFKNINKENQHGSQ